MNITPGAVSQHLSILMSTGLIESNNIGNRVVAAQKEDVVDYDIFEALNMKKSIDMNLYNVAHEVSI